MQLVADRLGQIRPSPTLEVSERARELRRQGVDVISLAAGEPDFDTPAHIVAAAKTALDAGMTRYTPATGISELKRAVADESARVRGVPCDEAQVTITAGAKFALYAFFQAVLNPGDEVIIPAPYWVSYPEQVRFAGGLPIIVPTRSSNGFKLDVADFLRNIAYETKVVVINTPNNPAGGVYSADELAELIEVATSAGIWVLVDEVYRELVYGEAKHVSPLSLTSEKGRKRVFIVDGVSKAFAMTGWRIGWGIGHPDVIGAMAVIQGQSTTNAAAVSQSAALAGLTGPKDFIARWRSLYAERRDVMCRHLAEIPGVTCSQPDGAFYALPSVEGVLERMGQDATDISLCNYLLDEANVAVVPGSAFGAPGHIRLSYATSLQAIEKAIVRMKKAIEIL